MEPLVNTVLVHTHSSLSDTDNLGVRGCEEEEKEEEEEEKEEEEEEQEGDCRIKLTRKRGDPA